MSLKVKPMLFKEWVEIVLIQPALFIEIARTEGYTDERIINLLTKVQDLMQKHNKEKVKSK